MVYCICLDMNKLIILGGQKVPEDQQGIVQGSTNNMNHWPRFLDAAFPVQPFVLYKVLVRAIQSPAGLSSHVNYIYKYIPAV